VNDFDYDAFISYRRSDGIAVARWLRRELESFRLPRSLRGTYGRKLRIYMDTAYERGTSDFYNESIKPALLSSRYLLVVATPNAMRRPNGIDWIDNEVRDFSAGPNGQNVIAVRGAGEFDAELPAGLKQRFPNIEIVDLRGAGRFWYLNPVRAVRLISEKLKLVAPLFALPPAEMPKLRQEEEKRQQSRLGVLVGATLGVIVAVSGLSVLALQSRNQAIRAAEDAMFAVGGMALQAASLDADDDSVARTRRLIVNRGCDLVDKFSREAPSGPQIGEAVMCKLERALAYEGLAEHGEARKQYDEAIQLAAERHERLGRLDAALALLRVREAYAARHVRQKDTTAATDEFARLRDDARRLGKAHEGRADIIRFEAEALGQLGDQHVARKDLEKGSESYDEAAAAVDRMLKARVSDNRDEEPRQLAWLARLHRLSGEQLVALGRGEAAAERFRRSIALRDRNDGKPLSLGVEYEIAVAYASMFALEKQAGKPDAGEAAKAEALRIIDAIAKSERAPKALKERVANLKRWIEAQAARQ
jgi:hypothetical protein